MQEPWVIAVLASRDVGVLFGNLHVQGKLLYRRG